MLNENPICQISNKGIAVLKDSISDNLQKKNKKKI